MKTIFASIITVLTVSACSLNPGTDSTTSVPKALTEFNVVDYCGKADECSRIVYGQSLPAEYSLCVKSLTEKAKKFTDRQRLLMAAWVTNCEKLGPCGYHYCVLKHTQAANEGYEMQKKLEMKIGIEHVTPDAGYQDAQ